MFVVTADQVSSRTTADRVGATLWRTERRVRGTGSPFRRTAPRATSCSCSSPRAPDALEACLALDREHGWSIGVGVGSVQPSAARGGAGIGRRCVHRRPRRGGPGKAAGDPVRHRARDTRTVPRPTLEALVDLLLVLRARRSAQGWELYDLLEAEGITQADAAARLGDQPAGSEQAGTGGAAAGRACGDRTAVPAVRRVGPRLSLRACRSSPIRPDAPTLKTRPRPARQPTRPGR